MNFTINGNRTSDARRYGSARQALIERSEASTEHPPSSSLGLRSSAAPAGHENTNAAAQFEDLLSKSVALNVEAVNRYNFALRLHDEKSRAEELHEFEMKLRQAVELSTKTLELMTLSPRPTNAQEANQYYLNTLLALAARAESLSLLARKADHSERDAARSAFRDYLVLERDAENSLLAKRLLAQTLFEAGALEEAIVDFEELAVEEPRDPEIKANLGLIFFELGTIRSNEQKPAEARDYYKRAATYLQDYLNAEPSSGAIKTRATTVFERLKSKTGVQTADVPEGNKKP